MISLDEEQKISAARIAVQQKGRMVFRARAVEKFIIENHVDELQIENAVSNVKKDIPSLAVNPPLKIIVSVLKTVLSDSLKQANTL